MEVKKALRLSKKFEEWSEHAFQILLDQRKAYWKIWDLKREKDSDSQHQKQPNPWVFFQCLSCARPHERLLA